MRICHSGPVSWSHVVLPAKSTLESRRPTALQVITALAGAGCYGWSNFEAVDGANETFRHAIDALAIPSGRGAFDLCEISLHDSQQVMHSVDADTEVACVSFRGAEGEPLLRAVLALSRVMGAVTVADAGAGDEVRAVVPTDDIDLARAEWPW